jgi:inner membrane protein
MPTMFTHPVIPLAIAAGLGRQQITGRLILLGALFSVLPDFDVIAFYFGIPYSSQWGHRGFTHSLLFAAAFSGLFAWAFANWIKTGRLVAFAFLFIAMGSHGLLDMLTDGGLGIALLWPFTEARYFFPAQVVTVSPIGMGFFSEWGLRTVISEFFWIWLPALGVGILLFTGMRVYKITKKRNLEDK